MDEESDAAVIAASRHEPGAFGAIFDRHATALHRYVVRRIGPGEAEAVVGDVFRIAFEKRHGYDVTRPSARPWLYGIATNLVAKHRRREARRLHAMARLVARQGPASDHVDQVSAAVDAAAAWQRVAGAVAALPRPERDALVLHVWEGLAYDEVAVALAIPVGTVRSRLHRARGRLRALGSPGGEQQGESTDQGTGSPAPGRIGS
ncbi:MAG TPA: RNA polymerase sigma factor [Acidimicrobiales bacterium]|nr:RNA polymerase sigma factor [Acidimicrobiales bacterium]